MKELTLVTLVHNNEYDFRRPRARVKWNDAIGRMEREEFTVGNCLAEECDDLFSVTMKQLNNYTWGVEAGNNGTEMFSVALGAAMLFNKLSDDAAARLNETLVYICRASV